MKLTNAEIFASEEATTGYIRMIAEGEVERPAQMRAVEHAGEMTPIVYGDRPETLLELARPNERKEIRDYRLEVYQPIVSSYYNRVCHVINTIWNPQGYEVRYKEIPASIPVPPEEYPEVYFEKKYGPFGSLVNYVSGPLQDTMFADPNAVVWSKPNARPGAFPEPYPVVFPSDRVRDVDTGERIVVEAAEKSPVRVGGSTVYEGLIYYIFLPEATIRAVQIGDKKAMNFEYFVDRHNLGKLPARVLGGISKMRVNEVWNQSFIAGVLPAWNKAIQRESDFDAMMIVHMVAQRIQIDTPCRACRGRKKVVVDARTGEEVDCPACKGSGSQVAQSAYEAIHIDPDNEAGLTVDNIVRYVQQDISQAEFIQDHINALWQQGMEALVMEAVNHVGTNQSGVAKDIELTHLKQFLAIIAKHQFDFLEWFFAIQTAQRYGPIMGTAADPNYARAIEVFMPIVQRPYSFDNQTLSMLITQMKDLASAGVHPVITRQSQIDVIRKLHGPTDKGDRLIAEIELDPYSGDDPDAKLAINARQNYDRINGYISDNIKRLISAAEGDDATFWDKTRAEQSAIIRAIAEAELAAELEGGDVTTADSEAQAKIRGSVGGVTGIVQLATAVAQGVLAEEAAENILNRIYGISLEEARGMIATGTLQADIIEPVDPLTDDEPGDE